jgi:hypothetical protein
MNNTKRYYTVKAVGRNFNEETLRIGVKLEITEGPRVGETGWYNGDLSEGWAERTIEALKLLGWDGEDFENWTGLGDTLATVVAVDEEYPPGTIREKFKYINAYKPRGAGAAPLSKASAKKLAAKFKALAKSVKVEIDPAARISASAETDADPF